jgi:isopenicillin-N N-acyltransferase-like protein
VARAFLPGLESLCPEYVEEMQGLADGAGLDLESIVALNVRTEIAYGMSTDADGCTAFAWKTPGGESFLGQNWDWSPRQIPNVVCLTIEQAPKPTVSMMTEGGIIGKIGMNSAGVGVTMNAIQAPGVSYNKLPVHLAARRALDSTSREEAAKALRKVGVAAAIHMTVADASTGAVGFECTALDIVEMPMDRDGICTHSNHLVEEHKVRGTSFLDDSAFRLNRIQELTRGIDTPTMENLSEMLKDEENYPAAICRDVGVTDGLQTIFSIVMDLKHGVARVKLGRPTEDGEVFELSP